MRHNLLGELLPVNKSHDLWFIFRVLFTCHCSSKLTTTAATTSTTTSTATAAATAAAAASTAMAAT
jgi:hypothetical protein